MESNIETKKKVTRKVREQENKKERNELKYIIKNEKCNTKRK